jgi:hypothetical protein
MGIMKTPVLDPVPERTDSSSGDSASIADLFLAANRELANSDARLYRSLDRHLRRTRELLAQEDELSGSILPQSNSTRLLTGEPSYKRQTRRSLQVLCRDHGITGYSRMTKKDMIDRLVAKGVDAPQIPLEALSKAELIEALRNMMNCERHAD